MAEKYSMAYITAPGKVEFQERELPELGPHDVLIRIKATAICGSDMHIFKGKHPFAPLPVAVGHEIAGEVRGIGSMVRRVTIGDRIAVEPVIVCGECHYCQIGQYHLCSNISFQYRRGQGGFARYFIADEKWVHKLPGSLTYEEGALLEPFSVAVHAVRLGNFEPGDSIAVFGDGAIGLFLLLLIKLTGGGKTFVVGIQSHRLELARQMGASMLINNMEDNTVERIVELTAGMGVHGAFEAVGIETTLIQSLEVLRKGGVAVLVGIFEHPYVDIPANLFIQKEITLKGSQGYSWDFQRAIKMIEQHDIRFNQMITHRMPLESLQDGFDLLMDPNNHALKVIITQD